MDTIQSMLYGNKNEPRQEDILTYRYGKVLVLMTWIKKIQV
jgi:hypothetical protein